MFEVVQHEQINLNLKVLKKFFFSICLHRILIRLNYSPKKSPDVSQMEQILSHESIEVSSFRKQSVIASDREENVSSI
jgi:hypothetical protein